MNFLKCIICKNNVRKFKVINEHFIMECVCCGNSNDRGSKKIEVSVRRQMIND